MSNVPWSKFSHVRGEALFQFHSIATRYHGLAIVEWRTWMLKYPVISLSYPDDLSIWLPVTNIVPGCEPYPVTCISMYISFSPTLPPPWWCINSIAGCTWLNPTSAHNSLFNVNSRSFHLALHYVGFVSSLCPILWICRRFCGGELSSRSEVLEVLTIPCLVDDIQ